MSCLSAKSTADDVLKAEFESLRTEHEAVGAELQEERSTHRADVQELEGMQDQLNKSATAATSRPSSATVRVARGSLRALSPEEIARRQAKARHFSRGALTSLGTN